MRYIKLTTEFATDPRVQGLTEVMQRRLVMLRILVDTLGSRPDRSDAEIATWLRIPLKATAETRETLVARGLINDGWELLWRGYVECKSAERTRKYREAKRHSDVTVTSQSRHSDVTVTSHPPSLSSSPSFPLSHSPPIIPTDSLKPPVCVLRVHADACEDDPKLEPLPPPIVNSPEDTATVLAEVRSLFGISEMPWMERFASYLKLFPAAWVRRLVPIIHAKLRSSPRLTEAYGSQILLRWRDQGGPPIEPECRVATGTTPPKAREPTPHQAKMQRMRERQQELKRQLESANEGGDPT